MPVTNVFCKESVSTAQVLQPRTKPVETHYKNTYFFALTLTKMLTVAN